MKKFTLFLFLFSLFVSASGCGNRFDLATERGRQARIDEANLYLSTGHCQLALDAINPLYNSEYVNDEVRIVRASASACFAGFNFFDILINVSDKANVFEALSKSMPNTLGDGDITNMYAATDVITQDGVNLAASSRSTELNNFMFFLQVGMVGSLIDAYGEGNAEGVQQTTLDYLPAGAGTMSNEDACALAAAHSIMVDSYNNSDLSGNADATKAVNTIEAACQAAVGSSCTAIEQDRSVCDGANAASTDADSLAGAIDAAW